MLTCGLAAAEVHEHSGVRIQAGEVCSAVETGSVRTERRLPEAHGSVRQEAWCRHRHRHRGGRPEVPGVQAESLQPVSVRGEVPRRLVSELRREDALDAEVGHAASVHDDEEPLSGAGPSGAPGYKHAAWGLMAPSSHT